MTDKLNGKSYTEAIFGQPVLLHLFRPDDWNRYPKRPPTEVEVRNVRRRVHRQRTGPRRGDEGHRRLGRQAARRKDGRCAARARRAIGHACENGEPVATPGVQFSQPWILLLPPPAPPAQAEKN